MHTRNTLNTLIIGHTYSTADLDLVGWAHTVDGEDGRYLGSDIPGYDYSTYFSEDGRYLGPDEEGVEPLFSASSLPPSHWRAANGTNMTELWTGTLADLHRLLRERRQEQAPGSEPSWWGDYVEDCRQRYAIMPWDGRAHGIRPTGEFAEHWLAAEDVALD